MGLSMDIPHAGSRIEAPHPLGADDVHLWRVDLMGAASGMDQWMTILSPDELERAARFHFQKDRQRFVAARAILRQIIGSYLAVDPAGLVFSYSKKDKPALAGDAAHSNLTFNISHSGGVALLAFTRSRQIGVDIEQIRRDFDTTAIAGRFFSTTEQQELTTFPAEQRDEVFFRIWTRKEAYIKATGEGLSLPLNQFDVSLAPNDQNALQATRPDPLESGRWSLRDITVQPGYAAALCVFGTGWRLVDWAGNDSIE
jgi:4'-phosphopantetheinyl transferase